MEVNLNTTLVFAAKRLIGSLKHVISMGSSLMYGLGYISVDIALVAISAAALKRAVLSFKSGTKLSPSELKNIGKAGSNSSIRVVNGTADDALNLFNKQIGSAEIKYFDGGMYATTSDCIAYTYRAASKSGPPTIDINGIKGLRKIKYVVE